MKPRPFIVFALLLAGCTDNVQLVGNSWSLSPLKIGDEIGRVDAASGVICRARKVRNGARGSYEDLLLICDGWQSPAGAMRRLAARDDDDLDEFLENRELSLLPPGTSRCDAVEEPSPDLLLQSCRTQDGLPLLRFAARGGENVGVDDIGSGRGLVYVGHGLPHLVPLIDDILAGRLVRQSTSGSQSPLRLMAKAQIEAYGDDVDLVEILSTRDRRQLARLQNQSGAFDDAARSYEAVLADYEHGIGRRSEFSAPVYSALGLTYAYEGRMADASLAFSRADERAEAISWSEAYGDYLRQKAVFSRLKGDDETAYEFASDASRHYRNLFGDRSPAFAQTEMVEAGILADRGALVEARRRIESATDKFEAAGDMVALSFALSRKAAILAELGELREAQTAAEAALDLIGGLFGSSPNLVEATFASAELKAARGGAESALIAFENAIAMFQQLPAGSMRLRPNQLQTMLALLFERGRFAEAFMVMQLPQSLTIDMAQRRMLARVASGDAELASTVRSFEEAKGQLEQTRLELGRVRLGDPDIVVVATEAELEERVSTLETAISSLERSLQASYPDYARHLRQTAVDPNIVAAAMAPGELLLQILVTADASFAILLNGQGRLHGHQGKLGEAALEREVQGLRKALTFVSGLQPFDTERAQALYRDLLGNLDKELMPGSRLAIVSQGPLASLPFALLVRDQGQVANRDYGEVPWLGGDVATTRIASPAALVLARSETRFSMAKRTFLGVGDPTLNGTSEQRGATEQALDACLEEGTYDPALLRALSSLPETRDELQEAARTLDNPDATLLFQEQASEVTLKQLDLDDYRIISFATHGLLPHELRCRGEPGLVLTPPQEASDIDDGFLTAGEIAGLGLDADLVVLSACNTAGPDGSLGGEALSGLASAFAYAGARKLMVSHWDVASEPTALLMRGFFEAHGRQPAQGWDGALQDVQVAMIATPGLAHPAFWAAFELVGVDSSAAAPLRSVESDDTVELATVRR